MSVQAIQQDGQQRMKKTLEALTQAFAKIRTGRANPALVEDTQVSCYGSKSPLKQVANIAVEEGRVLVVTPWDPILLKDIEKALLQSDVGITPTVSGNLIRLPMPPLNEANRKQQVKLAKHEAEQARVAIRNVRRDLNNTSKAMLKEQSIGNDEDKRIQNSTQRLTDVHIQQIGQLLDQKEKDLMDLS